MEAMHSIKSQHYFAATNLHTSRFFQALSRMCIDQVHTDLYLVTGDGQTFAAHQIVMGSCSPLMKEAFSQPEKCSCENRTLYLPDFSSGTVKSLLCLLYTGSSGGECNVTDLKQLTVTLKIDLDLRFEFSRAGPNNYAPQDFIEEERLSNPTDSYINDTPGNILLNDLPPNHLGPIIQPPPYDPPGILAAPPNLNIIEDNRQMLVDDMNNGIPVNEGYVNTELPVKEPYFQGEAMETLKGYLCRLCGHDAQNGASLFTHLLYPHYAYLWRNDIPKRQDNYDCDRHVQGGTVCTYSTKNRQNFVMHVAKVHNDLEKKLRELGENMDIIENLHKNTNNCTDRIYSTIAKMPRSQENPEPLEMHQPQMMNNNQNNMGSSQVVQENDRTAYNATNEEEEMQRQHSMNQGQQFKIQDNSTAPIGNTPDNFKCSMCGKLWRGKDTGNFFHHMVSSHFKHLWDNDVPKRLDVYKCQIDNCNYDTNLRFRFLFHLAGKHKQLEEKLSSEGISMEVIKPILTEEIEDDNNNFNEKEGMDEINNQEDPNSTIALLERRLGKRTRSESYSNSLDTSMQIPDQNPMDPGTPTGMNDIRVPPLERNEMQQPALIRNENIQYPIPSQQQGNEEDDIPNPTDMRPKKCRLCGKGWKENDTGNFFKHMVSTHFKHLWDYDVPKTADTFKCDDVNCNYEANNRFKFLFHLAGKHNQLKDKLLAGNISIDIIKPVDSDNPDTASTQNDTHESLMVTPDIPDPDIMNPIQTQTPQTEPPPMPVAIYQEPRPKRRGRPAKILEPTLPPLNSQTPLDNHPSSQHYVQSAAKEIQLICKMCQKVSPNHACHRQHVINKHFQDFWSHIQPSQQGTYNCHHTNCSYSTTYRSVFVIHLAYKHFELKTKLEERGRDKECANPDIRGKRQYGNPPNTDGVKQEPL